MNGSHAVTGFMFAGSMGATSVSSKDNAMIYNKLCIQTHYLHTSKGMPPGHGAQFSMSKVTKKSHHKQIIFHTK